MFARIMSVVLAVILILTISFGAIGLFAVRQERIRARLDTLTVEAREIAWLAAQNTDTGTFFFYRGTGLSTTDYLSQKARQVYQRYGAYIVVVDRQGRLMDNFSVAMEENPEFINSLDGTELGSELDKVVSGEEIVLRSTQGGSPVFTVGVPFIRSSRVLGAVLIRTPAQKVEGDVADLILPLALIAAVALLLSGIVLFLYIRRVMSPLKKLTRAAQAMARGDFSVRVNPQPGPGEIAALSSAFDTMEKELADTEQHRRDFVANVSHELRSPVTAISGFAQAMQDGTVPPEEHPRYLALIRQESDRLTKLIRDLLALSRLEREDAALQKKPFDLCELLRRAAVGRVNDLEAKRIDLAFDLEEDSCMVMADPDRMEQVAVNLLDNAVKFTPEGGHITLQVHTKGAKALCRVEDDGIGISPADMPRIFERFYTADRAHTAGKGTGLGLSICQRIMAMHGEQIWAEDRPEGTGAALCFTLPLADQPKA